MRVLVTGSRDWKDRGLIFETLDYIDSLNGIDYIIEGCARGADNFAEQWAYERLANDRLLHYPADWQHTLGVNCGAELVGYRCRREGPLRNSRMLVLGKPTLVVAFHDDLRNSRGTGDMVHKSEKANVEVYKVKHTSGNLI